MKELPADLADSLHILSPWILQLLGILAALALLVPLWMLWRRRRGLSPPPPSLAPPPRAATATDEGAGIKKVIDQIYRRYQDADRRDGCHELSVVLRSHFEGRSGHRLSTSTVQEIAKAIGDGAVSRLFGLLADLQFGRRPPSHDDFQGICEVAGDVVAAKPLAGKTAKR